jgi:hypothetical protein
VISTPRRALTQNGVEANARLTAMTGVLLLIMLAAEGLTILSIHPLLSWHVAIGLALIPPLTLKLFSTIWRFAHYYLGDPAYRRAGPPPPLLRAVGPVVVLSTIAVLASGVALWAAGPSNHALLGLHKTSFAIFFAAMTVHVLGRTVRAGELTRADLDNTPSSDRVRGAGGRQVVVVGSFLAGLVVAGVTWGLSSSWSHLAHHVR